jgi:hypothetical protein
MTHQLEETLHTDRREEMGRYGRTNIYHEMEALLSIDRLEVFRLVNYGLAMVDDVLDKSNDPLKYLRHIREIFMQSYAGEIIEAKTPEEQVITDLGYSLKGLTSRRWRSRAIGRHTYREVLNFWDVEEKNLQRRWEILDRKSLDELATGIGGIIASQFLYILDTPKSLYEFSYLSKKCGFAIKLADNLCDYKEDIQRGLINIAQEDIHHIKGIEVVDNRLVGVDVNNLSLSDEYIQKEFERIQQIYDHVDNLLIIASAKRPIWRKEMPLFHQLARAWYKQAKDFVEAA